MAPEEPRIGYPPEQVWVLIEVRAPEATPYVAPGGIAINGKGQLRQGSLKAYKNAGEVADNLRRIADKIEQAGRSKRVPL